MVRLAGSAALGLALLFAVALAAWGRPPRRATPTGELRGLLVGTAALYAAAVASLLYHRALLAEVTCALGVVAAALAAWLSRGSEPPDDDGRGDVDWDRFDRARRRWERPREPSSR